MHLIILPGTDGTGVLLDEFRAALGDVPAQVIAYPLDRPLDHAALAAWIRPQLPTHEPYVLLGESFAGPLAVLLAADAPGACAGVVLCASYARHPSALLRALAPLSMFAPVRAVPTALLAWWLLARWSTPAWRRRLRVAIALVPAAVLRARLHAALSVDVRAELARVEVPLLHLAPTHDRVVPAAAAAREIAAHAPQTRSVRIDGPHFLLQAAASECAASLREFLAKCNAA
jgi:pimeloyl-ACP methyl ester carboxylesterase